MSAFTATLLPRNLGENEFLLASKTDLPSPGPLPELRQRRPADLLKVLSFDEQIHVFVVGEELKTEHSFSLLGARFLTLHYEIARISSLHG